MMPVAQATGVSCVQSQSPAARVLQQPCDSNMKTPTLKNLVMT
jgi:hypothetical protein